MSNFFSILFILAAFVSTAFAQNPCVYSYAPLDKMPIMEKTPNGFAGSAPIEQRGPEFRKFLSASVKISVNKASGSGTIVYFDPKQNLAYVASCGHLWDGIMSVEEGKQRNITCEIITWYHNEKKLTTPAKYDARVIFYSYIEGQDTSLIVFSPDWQPDYFPIGPVNYQYKLHAHSCGSDGGNETAHYDVEIIGINEKNHLLTKQNSPRPGRSGGGLMDEEYYIGTCWGTQYKDGSGVGFFTPLSVIHRFWGKQAGYEFLLHQNGFARQIPVNDRNRPQGIYTPEYILLPGRH